MKHEKTHQVFFFSFSAKNTTKVCVGKKPSQKKTDVKKKSTLMLDSFGNIRHVKHATNPMGNLGCPVGLICVSPDVFSVH